MNSGRKFEACDTFLCDATVASFKLILSGPNQLRSEERKSAFPEKCVDFFVGRMPGLPSAVEPPRIRPQRFGAGSRVLSRGGLC